jgi:hypothetical protein
MGGMGGRFFSPKRMFRMGGMGGFGMMRGMGGMGGFFQEDDDVTNAHGIYYAGDAANGGKPHTQSVTGTQSNTLPVGKTAQSLKSEAIKGTQNGLLSTLKTPQSNKGESMANLPVGTIQRTKSEIMAGQNDLMSTGKNPHSPQEKTMTGFQNNMRNNFQNPQQIMSNNQKSLMQ